MRRTLISFLAFYVLAGIIARAGRRMDYLAERAMHGRLLVSAAGPNRFPLGDAQADALIGRTPP